MPVTIGIRKEDKNMWERRTPLAPEHVRRLVAAGVGVVVQANALRAFPDQAYRDAGAVVERDVPGAPVLFAVKEIPLQHFRRGGVYMFFAHVIKGQAHNMPMLQRLLDLGCTLIDYEKVVDDQGRRLIFFGRHAGLAGMIDTLWALGKRLRAEGIGTPLEEIKTAHEYPDLEAARIAIRSAGEKLAAQGLPSKLVPMVFGFAGYGNVSQGAQEIFDLLPHRVVTPEQLPKLQASKDGDRLLKVVFKEEHMVVPRKRGAKFDLQEYFQHPERYRSAFARHVPALSVLVNCIYWAPKYPRLITRDLMRGLFAEGRQPRLRVIGDISCDIEGSIEITLAATEPGDPVFVYLPEEDQIVPGVEGHGPVVLAVDNLPCELPVESSRHFGDALVPYIEAMAKADFSRPFEQLELPAPIRRAVIVHQGKLAPDYEYLRDFLNGKEGGAQ